MNRVYKYFEEINGLYGVGAGVYVESDSMKILYETPSKEIFVLFLVRLMYGEE